MSSENVDVVMRGWEHFASTGEPLEEIVAPEFVWDMSTFDGWPEQPLYEGAEGMRAFLRDWTSAFEDLHMELESVHDGGDKVLCIVRQRGRAKVTGMPLDMRFAQVFTLRDRRQVRMQMYSHPDEAFSAARLGDDASQS